MTLTKSSLTACIIPFDPGGAETQRATMWIVQKAC